MRYHCFGLRKKINHKQAMTRVAIAVVAVPLFIILFSFLANTLCEVWCSEALTFLERGGGIATSKLNVYWFIRHLFLFLGTLAGLTVSQAAYLIWQGEGRMKMQTKESTLHFDSPDL